MNDLDKEVAHQIAEAASAFQAKVTGHAPRAVTVVLSEDTLVITLHDALSAAERAMSRTTDGMVQMQEFQRQLFTTASKNLREEIYRITGRKVREAAAEIEPATGSIVHAFTTGNMVQVFHLEGKIGVPESSLTVEKKAL
ncbi:DUF2294 domain-containing protein [bacterium]|nr:DUF2294 domain-containing protein [bacterium]